MRKHAGFAALGAVAASALLAIVTAVTGSASKLEVDGGILQHWTLPGPIATQTSADSTQ